MFRTPEFQQRIKLGISQKLLFSNLASGKNLIVTAVSIAAGQYL